MRELPIYDAIIDGREDGVFAVSLVDAPAVDSLWQAFAKQDEKKKTVNFSIQDEQQHVILGCILRANYLIYRQDGDFEYYLNFTPEQIKKFAEQMMRDGTYKNIDLNHDEFYGVEGVKLLQIFIKDTSKGINPIGFEDVADGSLFAMYKIDSIDLWRDITEGKYQGFSVEAWLTVKEVDNNDNKNEDMSKQEDTQELETLNSEENTEEIDVEVELDENEDNEEIEEPAEEVAQDEEESNEEVASEDNNNIVEAIKEAFSAHNVIETEEGVKIFYVDDEIAVGSKLTDESGNAIAGGEYTINGKTYKVEDGQVTEIIENQEETVEEESVEETTDVEDEVAQDEEPVEETSDDITTEEESNEQDNSEIEVLKATIETLKAEIEALKAEITKPAAPTVEEFSRSGNKGESKGESMLDYLYSIRKH